MEPGASEGLRITQLLTSVKTILECMRPSLNKQTNEQERRFSHGGLKTAKELTCKDKVTGGTTAVNPAGQVTTPH